MAKGVLSSNFGARVHPITGSETFHNGLDIAADEGTDVVAVTSGKVIEVGEDAANGKFVKYETHNGYVIVYAHLSKTVVKKSKKIEAGQVLGKCGNTGYSTGPHLHYSISLDGEYINPIDFVELPFTMKK